MVIRVKCPHCAAGFAESVTVRKRRRMTGTHRRYPVRVKRSIIHGLGVFATRRIRAGECIGTITGRVFDARDAYTKYSCFFSDDDGHEYGLEPDWPFCYLNGSMDPNTNFGSPNVIAARTIEADEEITIDYGYDPESD